MKVFACLVLCVLFVVSCKSGVPNNVLPVNEMKTVMWHIIEADEYANFSIARDSSKVLKDEVLKLYSNVFAQHEVSSELFGRSYTYYKEHPAMQKILLDSLQAYGTKMKERTNNKIQLSIPILNRPVDSAKNL